MANQGPKLGENGHFRRLGKKQGDQSYAVRRFTDEASQLYGVLNNHLYDRRYLAGDEFSIADIAAYLWTVNWKAQGEDVADFKHFSRWFEEVGSRPAVQRGLAAGAGLSIDPATISPEEQARHIKLLYNQRVRPQLLQRRPARRDRAIPTGAQRPYGQFRPSPASATTWVQRPTRCCTTATGSSRLASDPRPYDRLSVGAVQRASFTDGDLIASDLVYPHVHGETSHVEFKPGHRWYYLSQMQPDKALPAR